VFVCQIVHAIAFGCVRPDGVGGRVCVNVNARHGILVGGVVLDDGIRGGGAAL
jgi:hypothetical protein